MAKSLYLALFLTSMSVQANLFEFGAGGVRKSQIPALITKLKSLEIKDSPTYEEAFNLAVKSLENGVEEEKLYCSGEAQDSEGKLLPPAQKQLCMRELKKHYIEATGVVFDLKKKYLGVIHQRYIDRLSEIQAKQKSDIEKNF